MEAAGVSVHAALRTVRADPADPVDGDRGRGRTQRGRVRRPDRPPSLAAEPGLPLAAPVAVAGRRAIRRRRHAGPRGPLASDADRQLRSDGCSPGAGGDRRASVRAGAARLRGASPGVARSAGGVAVHRRVRRVGMAFGASVAPAAGARDPCRSRRLVRGSGVHRAHPVHRRSAGDEVTRGDSRRRAQRRPAALLLDLRAAHAARMGNDRGAGGGPARAHLADARRGGHTLGGDRGRLRCPWMGRHRALHARSRRGARRPDGGGCRVASRHRRVWLGARPLGRHPGGRDAGRGARAGCRRARRARAPPAAARRAGRGSPRPAPGADRRPRWRRGDPALRRAGDVRRVPEHAGVGSGDERG